MKNDESSVYILNVERGLIAAFLFDEQIFTEVADTLSATDFLFMAHQKIFEICLELRVQNLPIQTDFVATRALQHKFVSEEEFSHIIATSPIANVSAYIKEIKTASIKRQLATLATKIASRTNDASLDSDDLLDEIEKEVYAISLKSAHTEFQSVKSVIYDTMEDIRVMKDQGNVELIGIDTGFKELNQYTTGFRKGELIIIGARPAMGKTTFFLNMIQHTLNKGKGVAIFSLEMPSTQLMLRMLSSLTSIPLQNLRVGKIKDNETERLTDITNRLLTQSLFIDDGSSLTIGQLRSKLRKLKTQVPHLELAVVDYLQLMSGSGSKRGDSARHEEISEISRGLKTLARDLQIPIIALSQVSRGVVNRDNKRPQLSDLRESGSIEQDADVVLFLYRDNQYKISEIEGQIQKAQNAQATDEEKQKDKLVKLQAKLQELQRISVEETEIILAKNRNGATGTIYIEFNKPCIRFQEKAKEQEISYDATPTRADFSSYDSSDSSIDTIPI